MKGIRRIFDYDPNTGKLIRKNKDNYSRGYKPSYIGKVAGNCNDHGYIRVHVLGNSYRAHRLIWAWAEDIIFSHYVSGLPVYKVNTKEVIA